MPNSTPSDPSRTDSSKPNKPFPSFPLTPHASGAWMKKIRGRIFYFGKWARRENGKLVRVEGDGWSTALEEYKRVADDLHAGRTPRIKTDTVTLADLFNRFLTVKQNQQQAGELSSRMFAEYKISTDRLISTFGKTRLVEDLTSEDFEGLRASLAKQYGPVRLGNEIQKIRTIFKYGYESSLLDRPMRFGQAFRKPSASVLRKHRAKAGEKLFTADDIRRMLAISSVPLRAMVLLGINCAFGNADCATLPFSAVDLERGWINFPRPKTGIPRRCPLWPETTDALRKVIDHRPTPNREEHHEFVFITKQGNIWSAEGKSNAICLEMDKIIRKLKLQRRGRRFYALRHTFRTVADAMRDAPAVRLIMGHNDASIDAVYRERIEDARLIAITKHVRHWLLGE